MSNRGTIESEVRDIKQYLIEISKKIDALTYENEMISMMELSETSLSAFFENEEVVYTVSDLRVKYR